MITLSNINIESFSTFASGQQLKKDSQRNSGLLFRGKCSYVFMFTQYYLSIVGLMDTIVTTGLQGYIVSGILMFILPDRIYLGCSKFSVRGYPSSGMRLFLKARLLMG